jgi:hypothetical protein
MGSNSLASVIVGAGIAVRHIIKHKLGFNDFIDIRKVEVVSPDVHRSQKDLCDEACTKESFRAAASKMHLTYLFQIGFE